MADRDVSLETRIIGALMDLEISLKAHLLQCTPEEQDDIKERIYAQYLTAGTMAAITGEVP